nr:MULTISPECIES: alpha-L-rhamnosidase [Microbacterium]
MRLDGDLVADLDGDDHTFVAWPFDPLQPRVRHRVDVRVRDAAGGWSPWSASVPVALGALAPDQWQAQFIGLAGPEHPAQPVLLRTTIDVPAGSTSAVLYVTALGAFRAFIDGVAIDDSVLSPGWTALPHRLIHESIDLTALLPAGRHVLGIELTGGWFTEEYGFDGQGRRVYGDQPAVAAQLHLTSPDGSGTVIATGEDWLARGDGEIVASGIYAGETIDHRRRRDWWGTALEPGWLPAATVDADVIPEARTAPPVRIIESVAVAGATRRDDGRILLDFGQNLVGRLRLQVEGPGGTEIVVRHAEILDAGELATGPLRTAAATDRFVLAGDGIEQFEPVGTFHGFRYAELSGWPGEFDPASVTAQVMHTDLRRTGWFDSSHALLNRLHENVVWSMRGNFLALPTDCPQRDERMGWTGDAQLFAPTASMLYDVSGFYGSWLEDLAVEQAQHGGVVPFIVPDVLRFPASPAAGWGDAATVIPAVMWERYADREVLSRQLPSMRAWVDAVVERLDGELLWEGHMQFGDWLDPDAPPDRPGQSKVDTGIVATAYLFRSATLVAQAAGVLCDAAAAQQYAQLADQVRAAFVSAYITPDARMMSDAPTAYALTLTFDIVTDPALRARLGQRLAECVRRSAFHIGTGFLGTPALLDALLDADQVEVADRLLLQTECPSWLYPVTQGATTVWERWDSLLPDGTINPGEMTSFNHYALGAVVDTLYRRVAGIGPAAPGWRQIRFAPSPLPSLDHARARVDTAAGTVEGGWERRDGSIVFALEVPVGADAIVRLPGEDPFGVGPGRHEWSRAATPSPRPGEVGLGTPFRDIAGDAEAYACVIDAVTAAAGAEAAAMFRHRTDWSSHTPLVAGIFGLPPSVGGGLAQALGGLSARRG